LARSAGNGAIRPPRGFVDGSRLTLKELGLDRSEARSMVRKAAYTLVPWFLLARAADFLPRVGSKAVENSGWPRGLKERVRPLTRTEVLPCWC
jgi:hypothetical protein